MGFLNFWPLLALICIPIIIILYLLKQKAEDYKISSNYLWKEAYKNITATTPWEKLKNNWLMILQIAAISMLILSLMGPYLKNGGGHYENVMIIIDNSGSMNYEYEDGKTRLNSAINKAIQYVNKLSENTVVTIVVTNNKANILLSNSKDKSEIKRKLKLISYTELAGNISPSLNLIKSMGQQYGNYEAVFFTDENVPIDDIQGYIVDMSSETDNLGISSLSHSMNEDDSMIALVKVSNYSNHNKITDINLYIDNDMVDVKNITINANSSTVLYFTDIKQKGKVLKAEINEKDLLVNDNVALNAIGEKSIKKILLVTKKNLFLEKVIQTIPNVELYKTDDVDHILQSEKYDIYILDDCDKEKLPMGNILYVNPKTNQFFTVEKTNGVSEIEVKANHVTKYIENLKFVVNKLKLIKKPFWATTFLSYNEYSAGFVGKFNGRTIGVLAFDLHDTDLALMMEYPVLMHQIMLQLMDNEFMAERNYIAGDEVSVNANMNGSEVSIELPNEMAETIPISYPMNNFTTTQYTGIYKISQKTEKEMKQDVFVVNFPEIEAKQIQTTKASENKVVSGNRIKGGLELKNTIISLVIVFIIIEWIMYLSQFVRKETSKKL